MNATLEVVILPVSDPDKSLDFYRDKLASFADVSDPDGNTWVLQERGHRDA